MKLGERGQVTIPKDIRDRFGLTKTSEVEFRVVDGVITLRKKRKKIALEKWKGYCADSFAELGYKSVDDYIEDVRGR